MAHQNLRPHCETPDGLYELLGRLQGLAVQSIARRVLVCMGCVAWGLIDDGPSGKAAVCLAVAAGLSSISAVMDHVARDALMHLVSLHDLIRPRSAADLVAAALLAEVQAGGSEAALQEGTNGQAQG